MKRRAINLCIMILVLAGSLLLVYPYVSFRLSSSRQSYVVQQYNDSLKKMTAAQLKEEWELSQAYNAALLSPPRYDPFASGSEAMDAAYLSRLHIGESGVMCYIKIPKINVELPVFHGASPETLEKGIGHLEGSALPVGGEGTHAVLTGHTGLNTAKMFTDLTELETGDEFYIYVLDQVLAYRIDQIQVVEPSQTEALQPEAGRDYVTLVTCTPYGVNSHRLLVRGERIEYTQEEIQEKIATVATVISKETYLLCLGLAILILLLLIALIFKYVKRKRRR